MDVSTQTLRNWGKQKAIPRPKYQERLLELAAEHAIDPESLGIQRAKKPPAVKTAQYWRALVQAIRDKYESWESLSLASNLPIEALKNWETGNSCPPSEAQARLEHIMRMHGINPWGLPGYEPVKVESGRVVTPKPGPQEMEIVKVLSRIADEQEKQTKALNRIVSQLDAGHEVTGNIRCLRGEVDRLEKQVKAQGKDIHRLTPKGAV